MKNKENNYKTKGPLVSVIIPARNEEKNIKNVLSSLVNQIYENYEVIIQNIDIDSSEYKIYLKLTTNKHKPIGKGEASAIALVKKINGILASNNLKDIMFYIEEYNIRHVTTADLMIQAFDKGYINESEGNNIWSKMLKRKRKLGYLSFTECLAWNSCKK